MHIYVYIYRITILDEYIYEPEQVFPGNDRKDWLESKKEDGYFVMYGESVKNISAC